MRARSLLLTAAFFLTSTTAFADLITGSCTNAQTSKITTTHSTTLNGKLLNYTATVGYLEVTASNNTSKACIFYTAYNVIQPDLTALPRPVMFAFNGGPGSASVWLHLGFVGPERVDMGADGLTTPKPAQALIHNEFSMLDLTDIVMIDPVATGFSTAETGSTADAFFGVKNDYKSIAEFVRNYLNANNRWTSNKYIMGESYGGVRGTLLTAYLQDAMGIGVDGLILISPALSDSAFDFGSPEENTAFWTYFPSYAATAWYHKKSAAKYQAMTVEQVYAEAKKFAFNDYRDALDMGDEIDSATFDQVAQSMADFTGVSKQTFVQNNLQLSVWQFFGEVLASEGEVVGRYDSRFVAPAVPSQWGGGTDPSGNATSYPFTSAINDYFQKDLNFQNPAPYVVLANLNNWSYDSGDGGQINVIQNMSEALAANDRLKVFIASGYYDFACPMGTVSYAISQLPGGAKIRARVHQNKYEGGHMMYINPKALTQLKADLTGFMQP